MPERLHQIPCEFLTTHLFDARPKCHPWKSKFGGAKIDDAFDSAFVVRAVTKEWQAPLRGLGQAMHDFVRAAPIRPRFRLLQVQHRDPAVRRVHPLKKQCIHTGVSEFLRQTPESKLLLLNQVPLLKGADVGMTPHIFELDIELICHRGNDAFSLADGVLINYRTYLFHGRVYDFSLE